MKSIILSLLSPLTFSLHTQSHIKIIFFLQPMNSKIAYMQPYYS